MRGPCRSGILDSAVRPGDPVTAFAASLLFAAGALCAPAGAPTAPADSLRVLYRQGQSFDRFLDAVVSRRTTWTEAYARGALAPDVARRLAALQGTWHLLVVAVDRCGDSANTIPYVATLADSSAGRLTLRVVDPELGRGVMEAHRTGDGRAATPTVLILDETFREVGCWVERPAALAAWFDAEVARVGERRALDGKYAWYLEDAGQTTLRELLTLIEQAAPGQPCGGNVAGAGT